MFNLIKEEDYDVLANSNFAKNAIFYKDMIAFCNAFEVLTENKEELPNFCFLHTKELCLEGLCLLMKMYATEFKFETIKLSLEYMKILYYAVASYSEDRKTVDKEKLIEEFSEYRAASYDYCKKHKQEVEEKELSLAKKEEVHEDMLKKSKSKNVTGKLFNALYIIMFVMTFMALVVPATCAMYGKFSKTTLWIMSIAIIIVGLLITMLFRLLSKKISGRANDISYEAQVYKKGLDTEIAELKELRDQYNKIMCEKYEYKMFFSELFSEFGRTLSGKDIIKKAGSYKLLTYNVIHDVKNLFKTQQEEIEEVISEVESISPSSDYQQKFADVYTKIQSQDWMYYNAQTRLHFIKKFADVCEKNFFWKLIYNEEEIDPFGIDVRALSRENIVYLKSKDRKFVTSKLIDFMKTSYAKNLKDLEFSGTYNVETLKNLKSNYLRSFYNYDLINAKLNGVEISDEWIEEAERIPTYINMKLRLIENAVGLGNSDARVIRQMAESMFGNDVEEVVERSETFSSIDIEYPDTDCDKFEDLGDRIVYYVKGKKIVGYKV